MPPAQGLRDFDLVDEDLVVQHAVEVTSVQLPAVRAARASMERLRDADLGLSQSWSLTVHESADLRRIREHAAALLNELTARGVERVGLRQRGADAEVEELTQKLQAIGVVEGRALPALQPPRLIASGYGSGSIDPSSVTTAVEAELEKGDTAASSPPHRRERPVTLSSGCTTHTGTCPAPCATRGSRCLRHRCCRRRWTSAGSRWRTAIRRRPPRCFGWTRPGSQRSTPPPVLRCRYLRRPPQKVRRPSLRLARAATRRASG